VTPLAACLLSILLALCSGCAGMAGGSSGSASIDAPRGVVRDAASSSASSAADLAAIARRVETLLSEPLSQDGAAELALLQHPAAERSLAALGLASDQRLRMQHQPSPRHEGGKPLGGSVSQIERSGTVNLMSWLAVAVLDTPVQSPQQGSLRGAPGAAQADAHSDALNELGGLLFDSRRLWVQAVAARQWLEYERQVADAAHAARDLAERRLQVGHLALPAALQAQRFHAESLARLARAEAEAMLMREQLCQRLGLWGALAERLQLPARLPDLPAAAIGPEGLEALAVAQRLDVQRARWQARQPVVLLDARAEPRIEAHGEAHGEQEIGLLARGSLRLSWLGLRAHWSQARHARHNILPLVQRQSQQQQLRYNGMLIDLSVLIADAVQRVQAVQQVLRLEQRYWLSEVDLQQALAGVGRFTPSGVAASGPASERASHGHASDAPEMQ